ncbi:unnamed protein product [Nippostrongylus brasiliensis]|uniref:Uncharacterized protein n=1 Tax=Nippostrongylus brasiliensis TaxID=27835 RepID=A0A0N4XJ70_NIPBR|nr:unnamed protein product [Nippostrongylus brasiliensis]
MTTAQEHRTHFWVKVPISIRVFGRKIENE